MRAELICSLLPQSAFLLLVERGTPWPSGSALDWRPAGPGFENRPSLGHVSQIFHLIVPGDPCPDMTKSIERDIKPLTFHFTLRYFWITDFECALIWNMVGYDKNILLFEVCSVLLMLTFVEKRLS